MKGITMLVWQMFLKDVVEILLTSIFIYYCLRWLARDKGQRLLFMAYGFWGVATAAWLTNCFTLFNLLLMSFPLLACAMIILHKEQLQKNYIQRPLQKILVNEPAWVDTLIRSLLHAMNEGVACAALIQKEDLLSMHVPFMVESSLTVDLFKLIMRSNEFNPTCLVWFDKRGKLLGFNASPSDDCGNVRSFIHGSLMR